MGANLSRRHCIKDGVFIDPPYNTGHDFIYNDAFLEGGVASAVT
jgi:16S rRNA G966 N2-methylase RsmD